MGKDTEPLDSLVGRIATGIHQAAAATLCAPAATREELDLAALILKRDPNVSAPRESASSLETFNRLLDVALDSANASAHLGTRAERRSRLAADLGKAAVILLDCSTLAEFVAAKLELDEQKLTIGPGVVITPSAKALLALANGGSVEFATAANPDSFSTFATVPGSAIAGVTSAEELGAELNSTELENSGAIDVSSSGVND